MMSALTATATGEGQAKDKQKELIEIIARLAMGLLVSYIRKRMRKKRDVGRGRKKAEQKVVKLAKKGEEIPDELKKEAVKGLSRRQKRKLMKKAKKKAKKARKKKRGRKLLLLLLLLAAGGAAAMKALSKQ